MSDQKPTIDTSRLTQLRDKKIKEFKQQTQQELNKEVEYKHSLLIENLLKLGTDYYEEYVSEDEKVYMIRPVSIPESNEAMYRSLALIAKTKTAQIIWDTMNGVTKKVTFDLEDEINLLLYNQEENAWLTLFSLRDKNKRIQRVLKVDTKETAILWIKKNIGDLGKLAKRIRLLSGLMNKEKDITDLMENSENAIDSFHQHAERADSLLREQLPKLENNKTESKDDGTPEVIPKESTNATQ